MSKTERMNYLDKISGIMNRSDACKFLKDKATLSFLAEMLQPILNVQDNAPIVLRIGRTDPPTYRKFVPYLGFFSVDAAEGYLICGCLPGLHKCRKCENVTHIFDPEKSPHPRLSKNYELYQRNGERAWMKKILKQELTPEENEVLARNKKLNIANVANPLHDHFRLGNRNLFSSVPYDTLHTMHKGLLQQVFMWTLSVIQLVGKNSRKGSPFCNPFKELDKRIEDFPRLQSVSPWGPFK